MFIYYYFEYMLSFVINYEKRCFYLGKKERGKSFFPSSSFFIQEGGGEKSSFFNIIPN